MRLAGRTGRDDSEKHEIVIGQSVEILFYPHPLTVIHMLANNI